MLRQIITEKYSKLKSQFKDLPTLRDSLNSLLWLQGQLHCIGCILEKAVIHYRQLGNFTEVITFKGKVRTTSLKGRFVENILFT